jgi:hypothetical protein
MIPRLTLPPLTKITLIRFHRRCQTQALRLLGWIGTQDANEHPGLVDLPATAPVYDFQRPAETLEEARCLAVCEALSDAFPLLSPSLVGELGRRAARALVEYPHLGDPFAAFLEVLHTHVGYTMQAQAYLRWRAHIPPYEEANRAKIEDLIRAVVVAVQPMLAALDERDRWRKEWLGDLRRTGQIETIMANLAPSTLDECDRVP